MDASTIVLKLRSDASDTTHVEEGYFLPQQGGEGRVAQPLIETFAGGSKAIKCEHVSCDASKKNNRPVAG